MNKFPFLVISATLAFFTTQAQAQLIDIAGTQNSTVTANNGDYQLGGSQVSLDANGLPIALNSSLDPSAGAAGPSGWTYATTQGKVWVSGVLLSDPKVVYSIAFQNTTSTTQLYNVNFSVPITPPESFSPAYVRGTVSGSLLNGGTNASVPAVLTPALGSTTGASGNFLQTSTLTLSGGGFDSTNVDLTPGIITAAGDGGVTNFLAQTLDYNLFSPTGPTGTYSALNLTLSFYLTSGDYASFTGRVDVVQADAIAAIPEPSNVILALLGLSALAIIMCWRRVRIA